MKVSEIGKLEGFSVLCEGETSDNEVSQVYCCDLLSFAMGRAPRDCAWITVMSNVNTLAVATLAEVGCVVLAEGVTLDENTLAKAKQQEITVYTTERSVFQAGLKIQEVLTE